MNPHDAPHPPHVPVACALQTTAMHFNCILKEEKAMCLEKIQREKEQLGLNDSSPGEWGVGGGWGHCPSTSRPAFRTGISASGHLVKKGGGRGPRVLRESFQAEKS